MNWIPLQNEKQLDEIREISTNRPQIIFKHSYRCGISAVAKNRLEKALGSETLDFYFLDLIRYRSLSKKVAEVFRVYHESPQVLVIKNGECVYDESHSGISMSEIIEQATR